MNMESIERYEQMLAEDPQSRAFAPLAEAHRKLGHLDEAIKVARAGLELHPGYSGGLVVLGRALYEKGELDNAAEILHKAVSENTESYLGQKFLGKVLMDKGDNKGAQKALEAANFLSPEDAEVTNLLEEARSKASPPETMVYKEKDEDSAGRAQIVTYEQKPTTVDGIELPPLPVGAEGGTFSFSGGDTADPANVTPVPAEDEVVVPDVGEDGMTTDENDGDEMTATLIEEEEVEQAMMIESIDDLGPEAASFILEGEGVLEDSMDQVPGETSVDTGAPFEVEAVVEEEIIVEEEAPYPPAGLPETQPAAGVQGLEADPTAESVPAPASPSSLSSSDSMADERDSASDHTAGAWIQDKPRSAADPGPPLSPVPDTGPLSSPEPPPASAPVSASGPGPEPVPQAAATTPPEPLPGDDIREDQFSTETLADLYAQQGLIEKAVNIYRQILEQAPEKESVRLKLDALQNQAPPESGSIRVSPISGETGSDQPGDHESRDVLSVLEGLLENVERIKRS